MHPYVDLAKRAIQEYVHHRKVLLPQKELSPEMQRRAGVFVCLKKHGQLRGCIGTFLPCTDNIHLEIIKNAICAAREDPRFNPVQTDELEDIQYSVDVLSEPEKTDDTSELDPKKYGIIVVKDYNKGLLLPDLEGVNTVQEQLRIAKMKGGIDPADDDVKIYKFTVERYK